MAVEVRLAVVDAEVVVAVRPLLTCLPPPSMLVMTTFCPHPVVKPLVGVKRDKLPDILFRVGFVSCALLSFVLFIICLVVCL